MHVWDADDNKYLDFFAGILTTSVGHGNKTVNKYIKDQVDQLLHTSTLYPNAAHVNLAESLAEVTPEGLDTFYFRRQRHRRRRNGRAHGPSLYRQHRSDRPTPRLQR